MYIIVGEKPWTCPECLKDFPNEDVLAAHLERHREVGRARFSRNGTARTIECPKRCGRHFRKMVSTYRPGGLEMEIHLVSCDGAPPLPDDWELMKRRRAIKWEREPLPVAARPPAPQAPLLKVPKLPEPSRPRRRIAKPAVAVIEAPPQSEALPEEICPAVVLLGAAQLAG